MNKQELKKKFDSFVEWNKKNWKAGGKERGKVIGLWIIVVAVIGALGGNKQPSNLNSPKQTKASEKEQERTIQSREELGVTLAGFNAIRNGMSYQQVARILGEQGEEMSSAGDGQFKTNIYSWKAGFLGANMNVTFQGGRVMAKAQFGLD